MKRLSFALLALAVAACSEQPTAVVKGTPDRYLQTLSLSVGQRADIRTGMQSEYDSLPVMSSSAVTYLGMERWPIVTPFGPTGDEVQVYDFLAEEPGRTVVTIRYTDGTAAIQDTIDVVPAAAHGAFAQIDVGLFLNTCAVNTHGAAYCWGGRESVSRDSMNDEVVRYRNTPGTVPGDLTFAAIEGGAGHTCGVTTSGAAYCWGNNYNGQLGDGGTTTSSTPVPVTGGLTFTAVSPGVSHTCGLTTDGTLYCWGNNHDGELGNGEISYDNPDPIHVPLDSSFVAVGAGYQFSCGLTAGGTVYCWGYNNYGELGDGTTTASSVPVRVTGGPEFVALSLGYFHACGLTAEGKAYCWGGNFEGELGDGTTTASATPVPVSGGLTFTAISAGQWATCGMATGGLAYCWGYNGYGQLGYAGIPVDLTPQPTPVPVSGALHLATISTGYLHTCGVTTDGVAYCWGDNSEGELGDGTTTFQPTPVPVFGP